MNENENTSQKSWDDTKALLMVKFIAPKVYIRKKQVLMPMTTDFFLNGRAK